MRLDGKKIAENILSNLKIQVDKLKASDITPTMAVILVGNDSNSLIYIKQKQLKADSIVYGGYSAGPMMLTPSLRGAEFVDDLNLLPKEDQSDIIWVGLNLIPSALAPHYKSDHPESAAVEKEVQYLIDNHIPYKTLHDGEAIIIDGAKEVIVK